MSTLQLLEQTLLDRRTTLPEGSYSAELFADRERLLRKVMEESFELCLELGRDAVDPGRVSAEAADLLFHVLVGLVAVDVPFEAVVAELERRR
jgi:phosphoribosyl-ATP pyrophosphohydrolase